MFVYKHAFNIIKKPFSTPKAVTTTQRLFDINNIYSRGSRIHSQYCLFLHTYSPERSIAATSRAHSQHHLHIASLPQQQQQQQQLEGCSKPTSNNLNVIDFFHPSLASETLFHYTFNFGCSGFPKRCKIKPEKTEKSGTSITTPTTSSSITTTTTTPAAAATTGTSVDSAEDVTDDHRIYSSFQIGDDAYFKRNDALGVADGVGGWRTHKGANPALYSRKLMHYAQIELDRIKTNVRPQQLQVKPDPVQVLESAYHMTTLDAQNEGIVGSTTACIVILCQDELRIANLGDCGVSVIRQNDYIFRSEEQQHSFNFPYQLGTASFDSPSDAQQFTVKIEEGDIIIVGSDGLFDNLYDEEILEEVTSCIEKSMMVEPQHISDALAHRARVVSEDPENPSSPFQLRAMHEGLYYQGGKADDISVLVAVVKKDEKPPERSPPPLP
ncbi:phosphatase 2C-like domain-containing protein [Mycotypha africana]|uniref:phosphatase 2C-like domain-containing protein n=1 Tax=Mycotypha africana TaxID=64632 RepID=UPI0023000FEF|nr:phosphatase 2C-like domain-containing protein [Mycotypha africana]KAI8971785.1 phosphatase 2C-like domain-containing protein [Mycotypha africana]